MLWWFALAFDWLDRSMSQDPNPVFAGENGCNWKLCFKTCRRRCRSIELNLGERFAKKILKRHRVYWANMVLKDSKYHVKVLEGERH